ncbi:hypothetical protein BOO86_08365 [Mycobacterium sp. CBMA 234]|nr:hypothetical protein [Mycolicibacterium sp. CBMA 234]
MQSRTRTAVQRRSIERTQAILDSAETLLAEQGYAAATIKAIGEHAGIPTASLYHYFADRSQVDAELSRLVQLWFSGRNATLTDLAHVFDESWAEELWNVLVHRKLLSPKTPSPVLLLSFEVVDRLFDVAFRRSLAGDDATID